MVTRSRLKHCFNFSAAHINIHKFNEVLKTAIRMAKKALEHTHYKRKDEKKLEKDEKKLGCSSWRREIHMLFKGDFQKCERLEEKADLLWLISFLCED